MDSTNSLAEQVFSGRTSNLSMEPFLFVDFFFFVNYICQMSDKVNLWKRMHKKAKWIHEKECTKNTPKN